MYKQSHYREVPRWEIFMEQELRFGLDLGQLALLKKRVWANYEQLLRVAFSCFRGQFFFFNFQKLCSVRTKKLHKIELRKMQIISLKFNYEFKIG